MSNLFPIKEADKHQLVSVKGERSFFYQIDGLDFSQMSEMQLASFYQKVASGLNTLSNGEKLKFYRLNGKNYVNLHGTVNLGLGLIPESEHLELFFGEKGLFSSIGIYDDYLGFNGVYKRIVSVESFPFEQIGPEFLPREIDFVLNIQKTSSEKALKRLDRIRSAHQIGFSKNKRDFASEGAYTQAEELIEELVHGEESLFSMELYFVVNAYSVEELNAKTRDLIQELSLKGIKSFIEGHNLRKFKSGLATIFSELIPGVLPEMKRRAIPNKTGHIQFLLPLHESKLMETGIEFKDTLNCPIYFNPFDKSFKNRNMLVTGASGGGKSVFVNKLVHSLIKKHPTVILDKGGSFKRLCLYHDGIELSGGINPMQFPNAQFLREFILSVVDQEKFKKLERGLLLKEIKIFLETDSKCFWELLSHLKESFPDIDLYFEDVRGFISVEETKPSKIFYVDIETYPKAQIAPLIIFLLEYFKQLPEREKILVFDECWQFLKDHSQYIDECFRTFRKSGAFPIAISQGLGDFTNLGSGIYSSITNNSYFKIFFPQEQIQDNDVDDFDNESIKDLGFNKDSFSECYLKTQDGKFRKTMRVFLSPLERELFHTEAGEDELFYKFYLDHRDYFPNNSETIEAFVRLRYED